MPEPVASELSHGQNQIMSARENRKLNESTAPSQRGKEMRFPRRMRNRHGITSVGINQRRNSSHQNLGISFRWQNAVDTVFW
jgi:hypothetical protein